MPDAKGLPLRSDLDLKQPLLGNSAYDVAKNVTTIILPALATAYAALAIILHLPFSVEVVGVIGVLVTFLGTVLKISGDRFNKIQAVSVAELVDKVENPTYNGQLTVNMTDPEKENYKLAIDAPWDELANSTEGEIRIKVVDESDPLLLVAKTEEKKPQE